MPTFADPVVRHWDFRRGTAGIAVLTRFAAERGVPHDSVLAGSGVSPDLLSDPDACVEAGQEVRVARNLAAVLPDAGLAVGRRYHATTFGALGYTVLSCRTMLDAVNTALRHLDLTFALTSPSGSIADGRARLALDPSTLPPDIVRFLVDRDLAAIHTVLGELAGASLPALSLDLPFPEPANAEEYSTVFGVHPTFDAPQPVATYDAALLDRELPLASPETIAAAEAQLRALAARRRARTGITAAVRAELARGAYDMASVAHALTTSPRTLRRHLAAAGTNFQALLDEYRAAEARRLLADPTRTVARIAADLGYADAAAFTHAHRRWFGTSPSRSRQP